MLTLVRHGERKESRLFPANLRGKRGPFGSTSEIRKVFHTTTPGPYLSRRGADAVLVIMV